MSEHTPAPWGLEQTTVTMGGFNVRVFRVTIPDWTPLDLLNEPDARLIAAAPALKAAAEKLAGAVLLLVTGNKSPGLTEGFNETQAALAAIRGAS